MKAFKITIAIAICFGLLAFTAKPFQTSLSAQLIGEWRNFYVKIKATSLKTGKVNIMEADSANWQTRLGIKPIRTYFKADGTYYSEYRNLKDSIFKAPSGTWFIKGDSVTMEQLKPAKTTLKMKLSIANNKATFNGMIDFDGDGVANDDYFGVQKKFTAQ
ncbi:hypothetical protein KXQ82_01255 [Mucilaginibacter sp. HMF5004]|uniref:hypothetical protein n=1 Tax=Mucilaginibacter rivuli TaxID=2857527 RepID=UPI001C5CC61E|nr:hypothetical protein [Mucilaginibacter rivuli]MBW4888316.1 hypothetical protein [Mucilaginibacter rivuli]